MRFTTKIRTQDGKVYDLGRFEHAPKHPEHKDMVCPGCLVVNAWTEPEEAPTLPPQNEVT